MKPARLGKVALDVVTCLALMLRGHMLPFGLRRQASASPTSKSIRLEITHVTHRLITIHRHKPMQRMGIPTALGWLPIHRRLPTVLVHGRPTSRQPMLRLVVPVVGHKVEPITIGHQTISNRKRGNICTMARPLIVKEKPVSVMANLDQATLDLVPYNRASLNRSNLIHPVVGGARWIHRQHMLDIHKEQLLMLLLMMQTQQNQLTHRSTVGCNLVKETSHRRINMAAILANLDRRRTRNQAAVMASMTLTNRLVIAVV